MCLPECVSPETERQAVRLVRGQVLAGLAGVSLLWLRSPGNPEVPSAEWLWSHGVALAETSFTFTAQLGFSKPFHSGSPAASAGPGMLSEPGGWC